ncbi:MAG: glycosyltransferase family 9 protein [Candidatus Omnitrophica bacterium]|nr:glycosyltransferase family 9 protein [Candidatus Omnitrophota bacterium]
MKILLVTLTNIGDVILTTPVIANLFKKYPYARLTVLAGPRAAGLFEGAPGIDRVIAYDKKSSLAEKWRLILSLRREKFDQVVDLRHTLIPILLGHPAASLVYPLKNRKELHCVDRHLAYLSRLGVETEEVYFIPRTHEAVHRVDELLSSKRVLPGEDIIVMSPGARSTLKTWTQEGFESVARALTGKGYRIVWIGGSDDQGLVGRLMQKAPKGNGHSWVSLCGETSLQELAEVLRRIRLFIGTDSGPMHLARAVGTMTVSIFGPTDPSTCAPRGPGHRVVRLDLACSPCEKAQCPYHHECMQNLGPEMVMRAATELLERDQKPVTRDQKIPETRYQST